MTWPQLHLLVPVLPLGQCLLFESSGGRGECGIQATLLSSQPSSLPSGVTWAESYFNLSEMLV